MNGFSKRRVVLGNPEGGRTIGSLLMPNGERAVVVDRATYERARDRANAAFSAALESLKANRVGSKDSTS